MLKYFTISMLFLGATAFQTDPAEANALRNLVLHVIENESVIPVPTEASIAIKGDDKAKDIKSKKPVAPLKAPAAVTATEKKTVKTAKVSASEAALELATNSFKKNKGKMELPLVGTIVKHFGKHQHPDLQRVMVNNSGIDIRLKSAKEMTVKAVSDGTVSGVQFLSGQNHVLILKHGHFYTVYSGLGAVSVQKDDKIKLGQSLGKVATVKGVSELHFEIWQDKSPTNPEDWLKN
jgi:septal ring factor EnvC (AmiA/AmiB activator)